MGRNRRSPGAAVVIRRRHGARQAFKSAPAHNLKLTLKHCPRAQISAADTRKDPWFAMRCFSEVKADMGISATDKSVMQCLAAVSLGFGAGE